jgi:hypothetical protein
MTAEGGGIFLIFVKAVWGMRLRKQWEFKKKQ